MIPKTAMVICLFIMTAVNVDMCIAKPSEAVYRPKDMYSWDYWFAVDKEAQTYHAFYLQYPIKADQKKRHSNQWVGHAVSTDLWTWKTVEDALRPIPGTFNDKGIATGSVVRGDDGRWYMWFTSKGSKNSGIALAVSDDLTTWEKKPESRTRV